MESHPTVIAADRDGRGLERPAARHPVAARIAAASVAAVSRSVIVASARTPFGRLGGGLADKKATELGAIAIRGALDRVDVGNDDVDYVIMGQVLQAGAGQAPARQAAIGAGLPIEIGADTINKVCASSIRAVEIADSMIRAGDAQIVVAGGMESMSNAPYVLAKARFGYRLGDGVLIDSMVADGLTSSFDGKHMVEQASFVSRELGITREEQDEFALRSQQRAVNAIDNGLFADEIVAVGDFDTDEAPRRDTTLEKLASPEARLRSRGDDDRGQRAGRERRRRRDHRDERGVREGAGPRAARDHRRPGRDRRRLRLSGADAREGRRARAPEGRQDDRRRRPHRGERGLCVRVAELGPHARGRSRDGERERRRGRARASRSARPARGSSGR